MVRRLIAFVLAVACTGVLGSLPSTASTGGVDDTGNLYPQVAFLLFYEDEGRYACSGVLVAPTVVLTAAHCTAATAGRVAVTFEPRVDDQAPLDAPRAADPAAGFTDAELAGTGYVPGTPYAHPRWNPALITDGFDVGIVELDAAVDITPVPLAGAGALSRLTQAELRKTTFRAVGYGTVVAKSATAPHQYYYEDYPLLRRYVDVPGMQLADQTLIVSANPNDPQGTGGPCFGDSGGPALLAGTVVGISSWVQSAKCRYRAGFQRVDTGEVREWLASFGLG